MYEIINISNIPIDYQFVGKLTTDVLKNIIFKSIKDFELTMKITDALEQPADFSNGNSWTRTSKFNSHCWFESSMLDSKAICRRFELKPEKKVQCLIYTDRATDTMIHGIEILLPLKEDSVSMCTITNETMKFIDSREFEEQFDVDASISNFNELFHAELQLGNSYLEQVELHGPLTVICLEPSSWEDDTEPNAIDGILYMGTGNVMKVYKTGMGTFSDDTHACFEIYNSDGNLIHMGMISDEPTDSDPDMDPNEWQRTKNHLLTHYGLDIDAPNVYLVEHA